MVEDLSFGSADAFKNVCTDIPSIFASRSDAPWSGKVSGFAPARVLGPERLGNAHDRGYKETIHPSTHQAGTPELTLSLSMVNCVPLNSFSRAKNLDREGREPLCVPGEVRGRERDQGRAARGVRGRRVRPSPSLVS